MKNIKWLVEYQPLNILSMLGVPVASSLPGTRRSHVPGMPATEAKVTMAENVSGQASR
ncbi:MAG: hypothetical protein KIT80_13565 [Chitinophagaceae bacterium]|nr:hypothetical protein [Chitinophagaceae bacterium]MCW5927937.1 hypothetical protein [Chitinophagaceae bacterium]